MRATMPGESPRLHPFTRRRVAAGTRPGTMARMGGVAVCALVLAVTGCAGGTGATPRETTPIASASPTPGAAADADEEIFRAAEDTYRAYVDALNRVDLADPATFEPVYAWLSGDALNSSRESLSRMHAERLRVSGASRVAAITGRVAGKTQVQVEVCLDVSRVSLTNETGESVVSRDRNDRQPLVITLVHGASPTGLTIDSSDASGGAVCG